MAKGDFDTSVTDIDIQRPNILG